MEKTIREEIIDLLLGPDKPLTVGDIKRLLGLPPETKDSEIYSAIEHGAKTLKARGYTLAMIPPRCRRCGYTFTGSRFKKPSRCPRCRSELIEPPAFIVLKKRRQT